MQYHSHLSAICDHKRQPSARNVFDKAFTHQQVYDMTLLRTRHLQASGKYQLMIRWECEIKRQLREDQEMRQFWFRMRHMDWDLNIRNALFGD